MSQTHTDDPGFSTKGAYVTGGEEFTRDTNYIEAVSYTHLTLPTKA